MRNNRAAAWGDFNNDGFWIFMSQLRKRSCREGAKFLFRNNGDGTFTDVAASVGVDDLVVSRGRVPPGRITMVMAFLISL